MKGFVVYSCITTIILLIATPFAIRDMGFFGLGVIILAGIMPVSSAIIGILAWKHDEFENPDIVKRILHGRKD